MDWQNSIPKYSQELTGKVIVLEAEPGQSRCDRIQQWLNEAQHNGATTWLLSCDRDQGGPWAGLNDLLNSLVPQIQTNAPDLIAKHNYELVHVLPALQRTIALQYLPLTDMASAEEQGRNHPADRAIRLVHGLIDLLAAWQQRFLNPACIIACDCYELAGPLVHRFFVELMRRRGEHLNLTLLITTDIGASESVVSQFNIKYLGHYVRLNLPFSKATPVCQYDMARLAQELETQVGEDEILLESNLPQLIRYWLLSDQPPKALTYQIRACTIYTKRGFYEDALVYGKTALAQLEHYCPEDSLNRSKLVEQMYIGYTVLNQLGLALPLLQDSINKTTDQDFLCRGCYMMAMLYARYLPIRDFDKAKAWLDRGLEELAQANLPKHTKLFRIASNRRGLALIKYRQGEYHEAMELGYKSFKELNTHLGSDRYLLQQSILLYTVAQVYAAVGPYEQAITYFTAIISMDSHYSEYYNERGNVYFKMSRLDEAIDDYLKAIELSPPYSEVWANLGQCYRLSGLITEAIDAYSTALDLDPNHSLSLVGRAQAFEILEQSEAALADYSTVLTVNPDQPLILANRAILNYDAGRYQQAFVDLDSAITLSPENADLYQNRAIALIALDRFEEAVQDLVSYLRLNPNAEDRSEVEEQLLSLQSDN